MRTNFTPPSPSDSGESFFLHDPQEVIYNRVKDIFESDVSTREEPISQRSNAMTVQAEIHSSSSGAASSSDDDLLEHAKDNNLKTFPTEPQMPQASSNHDYEDIYLVREEAKSSTKKLYGRSRSRTDSGSHSRSASTSSTRSHDVVLPNKCNVSLSAQNCLHKF
jgi:espin